LPQYEHEISELRNESPLVAKKQAELVKKKQELARIEEERKRMYSIKTELNSLKDRLRDKESQRSRITGESDAVLKQIEDYSLNLKYLDSKACTQAIHDISHSLEQTRKRLNELTSSELEASKKIASSETEIRTAESIKSKVQQLDVCPLCQSNITPDHIAHVNRDADTRIKEAQHVLSKEAQHIANSRAERDTLLKQMREMEKTHMDIDRELTHHTILAEKKEYLKRLIEQDKVMQKEVVALVERREALQQKTTDASRMDELYSTTLMEIEEISSRTEQDVDQTLMYKEREMEKMREVIKIGKRDIEQLSSEIKEFQSSFKIKQEQLEKKEKEEEELNARFQKLFKERDSSQEQIQKASYEVSTLQGQWRQVEDQINYLKVGNAKFDAEREALEMELRDYAGAELIKASLNAIEERLQKTQASLQTIGSINMRALEIYDEIKQEYDRVQEKVTTLQNEKLEIMKIIEEIDNKKKRTFMKTFNRINELFSSNFSRLSTKGQAFLEIENPEELFSGGVRIVIRMAKGKYFDVTSLSGGEQTLVALSLLFAIQEYKPYHFYIFDEIDAALDKRNSERLSALLKQYMRSGQYITITHNDAIILDANVLYGVSMHEGVSKILSLDLGEKQKQEEVSVPYEETPVSPSE
jgi:chromosome segregation protein